MTHTSVFSQRRSGENPRRFRVLMGVFLLFALAIIVKAGVVQIGQHAYYTELSADQHEWFRKMTPVRGKILLSDLKDGTEIPVALNIPLAFFYADPRLIKDPLATTASITSILTYTEEEKQKLFTALSNKTDPYEPIQHGVSQEQAAALEALKLPGVFSVLEQTRQYPEEQMGGHIVGFVGSNSDGAMSGKYGIEGYFNRELGGVPGEFRQASGGMGTFLDIQHDKTISHAIDGSDIVLTVDRNIQFKACQALKETVKKHQADAGSVVIMNPKTGAILAMCGLPDFEPSSYRTTPDINAFNNPVLFAAYEPGSIFKTITVAAGLDTSAIQPLDTFNDTGEVKVADRTIRNSDRLGHGVQTMTEALEKSLNTGMVYIMRKTGKEKFIDYIKQFGFGEKTGIELDTEAQGTIASLEKKGELYAANASFGQGILVTPLQMVAAYGAIANGGIYMKPYIVKEIRRSTGRVLQTTPTEVRRVIDTQAARRTGAMLVSVVEHGHGGKAGVKGYSIAGKTGTAQVAKKNGLGYEEDMTNGSFAGFGPLEDPVFAMVVRIDNPKDVKWAESTAAPLFGEMAEFLLHYFEVPPTRD